MARGVLVEGARPELCLSRTVGQEAQCERDGKGCRSQSSPAGFVERCRNFWPLLYEDVLVVLNWGELRGERAVALCHWWRRTVGREPVKAAKTLGMFSSPESLNSARIERMTPSMDSSFAEQSIGGVTRPIRALI